MRILISGAAAVALALASVSAGAAAPCTMPGMTTTTTSTHAMPHCTAKTGPVVWFVASTKLYYVKGSPLYGKGNGMYVCRATAVARGGHPGRTMTSGAQAMPPAKTMVPRPMTTPGGAMTGPMTSPMPRTTPGPGLPNSTNAAPGSMGSPMPSPMTSGNPTSGNQGNTGAPGAGGQVPNNPASTSNSNPSPTPHP